MNEQPNSEQRALDVLGIDPDEAYREFSGQTVTIDGETYELGEEVQVTYGCSFCGREIADFETRYFVTISKKPRVTKTGCPTCVREKQGIPPGGSDG